MKDSAHNGEQRVAAFFDLDKTVISKSSALAFGRPFYKYGLISRSDAMRTAVSQLVFTVAGAGPQQMERIKEWVGGMCRGWPVDQVSEIVARHLDEIISPCVYAEARTLIAAHAGAGHDVVIVSSSGHEVVDPIARLLGVADVIATRMEVAGGRYTGHLEFWAYGPAKAARIRALAVERGYRLPECYGYSDSVTDLPLLEAVGWPHAVNPDRALRRVAVGRSWPILDFAPAPASRRSRPAAPGRPHESPVKGQLAG